MRPVPLQPPPSPQERTDALADGLKRLQAQRVEWFSPRMLLKDGRELGLFSAKEIRDAILHCLVSEVKENHYRGTRPPAESWDYGKPLLIFVWKSSSLSVEVYFKFELVDDRVVIYSFHKSRPKGR